MLQKVTRLDSVPTAEETVLTTEVPTKESRLYTLLLQIHMNKRSRFRYLSQGIPYCCFSSKIKVWVSSREKSAFGPIASRLVILKLVYLATQISY